MGKLAKKFKSNRRRHKANPSPSSPRHNPPEFGELVEFILPGFGGFATTKFMTRLAARAIATRWPKFAKHAGALASIGSFVSAWFLAHKVKFLAKYQHQIAVGSGIATLQSLAQLYAPQKLGWLVGDPIDVIASADQQAVARIAAPDQQQLPDHLEEVNDNPAWYTYNDTYDAGRYSQTADQAPPAGAPQQPDLSDISELSGDAGNVFTGGFGN